VLAVNLKRENKMRHFILFMLLTFFLTDITYAYVGPGLGLGVIGTIVGVFIAVFLAIVGVIYYPLKRLLRKIKSRKVEASSRRE
jgi:uncharacterized membrane protein